MQLGLWQPNPNRKGIPRSEEETARRGVPLRDILAGMHPAYSTSALKKRILKACLLPARCAECSTGESWQGKHLALQLDHINGDSNDHRLENLRILCPNCHSQTPTYGGKALQNKTVTGTVFAAKDRIIKELLTGAPLRQALLRAGLSDAKTNYDKVRLMLADLPELQGCAAALKVRPPITLKQRTSPDEYRAQRHQAWLSLQQEKLAKLRAATYDFQKFGWATQVGRLLDMPPQKVVPWIRKVDPEFLNKCKLRSSCA